MSNRVVITGMGIWSCIGTDIETVKQSLYEGKSGIGLDNDRLIYGYRSGLKGIVETPVITKQMLDRHIRAGMSEEAQYAYMASRQAFAQAGISDEYLRENEVGCIFGNDSSAKPVIESSKIMDEKHDTAMLGYGLIFQSMNSTVNMNLSTIFHLRGVNYTISAACASGSHSIGLGYMVLCGGAQETNYYSMASFDALNAFSIRMDEPTKASRPFDKDRDGLIPSGGAAALVLEDYDHAIARGATILAEVVGYGQIFQSMNSTVNMNLSTIFHLRGVNYTISAACASGSHSIGLGYLLIKQGLQEMVLCGGAQETNYYSMASFDALNAFSIRMDEPTKASRPFDKDRDGLIPSGGAAALVLEDYEHAIARGATILAEVVGYGFSSNGGGISEPSDNGSVIAMTRAMKDAGVELDDIDYINAHATSTIQGDMYEAVALDRMFRGQRALIVDDRS